LSAYIYLIIAKRISHREVVFKKKFKRSNFSSPKSRGKEYASLLDIKNAAVLIVYLERIQAADRRGEKRSHGQRNPGPEIPGPPQAHLRADRPGNGPRQGRDPGAADSARSRLRQRRGDRKKRLNRARREVEASWYRQARAIICDRFGWRFSEIDMMTFDEVIETLVSAQYLADLEAKAARNVKTPKPRR